MGKRVMYHVSCVALLLIMVQQVLAHSGGILQIASEPTGPYLLSVWTSPTRLEVGNPVHITVSVADEDEAPILDAAVWVEIASQATEARWSAAATTAQATNKLFYEADVSVGENGRYNMTVQVEGRQGTGSVTFAIEVLPEGKTNWFMLSFIGLGLILSMIMFHFWEKQSTAAPSRKR